MLIYPGSGIGKGTVGMTLLAPQDLGISAGKIQRLWGEDTLSYIKRRNHLEVSSLT